MTRGAGRLTLAAGWVLLFSADPDTDRARWQQVGEFPTAALCQQARAGVVEQDTLVRIGGALADQPADNPLRQQAYQRARQRIAPLYRCAHDDDEE